MSQIQKDNGLSGEDILAGSKLLLVKTVTDPLVL
jgi:hypothetical protein